MFTEPFFYALKTNKKYAANNKNFIKNLGLK